MCYLFSNTVANFFHEINTTSLFVEQIKHVYVIISQNEIFKPTYNSIFEYVSEFKLQNLIKTINTLCIVFISFIYRQFKQSANVNYCHIFYIVTFDHLI